ncbi:MAG: hypothetical protein KatS3mg119_1257 [Rhodothalassiaceae bacterium]|nr:MAG: hypothetical protein KatS3mg119_1257 [Rhodothalassiaceae bacterium]
MDADSQETLIQLEPGTAHLPAGLLDAQQEGRLVFLCGAGISMPAGLPNFEGLVARIYEEIGEPPSAQEREAFDRGEYDRALHLLENRIVEGRRWVRDIVRAVLDPGSTADEPGSSLVLHEALLTLGTGGDGRLRLVTTNFDRLFEKAAQCQGRRIEIYSGPALPRPGLDRWDGLVHLHGRLPDNEDDVPGSNSLVLTSGDFGLAYLKEGWAARFITGLLERYTLCFVGYSANDTVMRYLLDALAAERAMGADAATVYAFAPLKEGTKKRKEAIPWQTKGVLPVFYKVLKKPDGTDDHRQLCRTLETWATVAEAPTKAKTAIVTKFAHKDPASSDKSEDDDFVGRVLWALSDESGAPAHTFATMEPPPPLCWLDEFLDGRFQVADLSRFGAALSPAAGQRAKRELQFSLLNRPTPSELAPRMSPWSGEPSRWDARMRGLAHWLCRHITADEAQSWRLLATLAGYGDGSPHPELRERILDALGKEAAHANVSPSLRAAWTHYALGFCQRIDKKNSSRAIRQLVKLLKKEHRSTYIEKLIELLSPCIEIVETSYREERDSTNVFYSDLVLAISNPRAQFLSVVRNKDNNELYSKICNYGFALLVRNLRKAVNLINALFEDQERYRFWIALRSVEESSQNEHAADWTVLIELVRDGWLQIWKHDPGRARAIAREWARSPHPVFHRLALFAAGQGAVPPREWVSWLARGSLPWLWELYAKREVMRLLVKQGAGLSGRPLEKLESAILEGPPREYFRENLSNEEWTEDRDRAIRLRLAKLKAGGCALTAKASETLRSLSARDPEWQLAADESDEFLSFLHGARILSTDEVRPRVETPPPPDPRDHPAFAEWLQQAEKGAPQAHGTVSGMPPNIPALAEAARRHPAHVARVLSDLAAKDVWPLHAWRMTLETWYHQEDALRRLVRLWRCLLPTLSRIPEKVGGDKRAALPFAFMLARWMKLVLEQGGQSWRDALPVAAWLRDFPFPLEEGEHSEADGRYDPVTQALNEPAPIAVRAIISAFFAQDGPAAGDRLPEDLERFLRPILAGGEPYRRLARGWLADFAPNLYSLDPEWCGRHVLPLFDWNQSPFDCKQSPEEARIAWAILLYWNSRISVDFLRAVREAFIETAGHLKRLGHYSEDYLSLVTDIGLRGPEWLLAEDSPGDESARYEPIRSILQALSHEDRAHVLTLLARPLAVAEAPEDFWTGRLRPLLRWGWPKDKTLHDDRTAEAFARMAIESKSLFPEVLKKIRPWLRPLDWPSRLFRDLESADLPANFPEQTLTLLDTIIGSPRNPISTELADFLRQIRQAQPELVQDRRYQRLAELVRRAGIDPDAPPESASS